METVSCLALVLLIPSAVHSHPPSCPNFAQLTQNHDLRMTVLTLGWGAICGPDTDPRVCE